MVLSQEVESVLVGAAVLGPVPRGISLPYRYVRTKGVGRGPAPVWGCPSS